MAPTVADSLSDAGTDETFWVFGWGRAYEVALPQRGAVLEILDQREQGGYEHHRAQLHFPDRAAKESEPGVQVNIWAVLQSDNPYATGFLVLHRMTTRVS